MLGIISYSEVLPDILCTQFTIRSVYVHLSRRFPNIISLELRLSENGTCTCYTLYYPVNKSDLRLNITLYTCIALENTLSVSSCRV